MEKFKLKVTQEEACNESLKKDDILIIGQGNFQKVYVSGAYIRGKLNEIFGVGNWNDTDELTKIKGYDIKLDKEKLTGYMAKVTLNIYDSEGNIMTYQDIGTGELKNSYFMEEDKARKRFLSLLYAHDI